MECSGLEQSEVECCGVEQSEVECCGVEQSEVEYCEVEQSESEVERYGVEQSEVDCCGVEQSEVECWGIKLSMFLVQSLELLPHSGSNPSSHHLSLQKPENIVNKIQNLNTRIFCCK